MKIEITSNKLDFIKIKHVSVSKDTTKKVKKKKTFIEWKKYLQVTYLMSLTCRIYKDFF